MKFFHFVMSSQGLFTNIFGYISAYFAILLLSASIVSGIYYLSLLFEEFPSRTELLLKYSVMAVLLLHILFWFDGFPTKEILVGISAHMIYGSLLTSFPFIELISIRSFASISIFICSNFYWIKFFNNNHFDFHIYMGFFTVMIWMIPLMLFISLSINENVLPGTVASKQGELNNGIGNVRTNIFKTAADLVLDYLSGAKWPRRLNGGARLRAKKN